MTRDAWHMEVLDMKLWRRWHDQSGAYLDPPLSRDEMIATLVGEGMTEVAAYESVNGFHMVTEWCAE